MGQYNRIKAKHPDAVLLFRVGDFYETFGEDAHTAAEVLGIVLTKRSNGAASETALAGFPHHSLNTYLPRLVKAGLRVAICEQLEDPKKTKTIVKRGVTDLITPGVAVGENMLDHKKNNFLAAVYPAKKHFGLALVDVSTAAFYVHEGSWEQIDKLLQGFRPAEVLYPKGLADKFLHTFHDQFYTYGIDDWVFQSEYGQEKCTELLGAASLKGFGIAEMDAAIIAAGAVLHYLRETEKPDLSHLTRIERIGTDNYVWLDRFSIRNLELIDSPHPGATTLLDVLDRTVCPMGARLMRHWIVLPLTDTEEIGARQAAVASFVEDAELADALRERIGSIGDLERLVSRIPLGKISPREMNQLKLSLEEITPVKALLNSAGDGLLHPMADALDECDGLVEQIGRELQEEAPAVLSKGNVIADGVDAQLDEYRTIIRDGKDLILQIQQREAEKTGITSLKVGFNNVFGYYLEVTHAHKSKVPEEWIRKQTLTNAERYITEELKELEQKILEAGDKVGQIEQACFERLVQDARKWIGPVQRNAAHIARIDCLLTLAELARMKNYCRPQIDDSVVIDIKDGRHPVIEQQLPPGEDYVPNDLLLDSNEQQLIVITGPNMSGKSAILRQTALICLMAQMGGFVPAREARIGLVDKIFTRVGASDNISGGESTFMVEMHETASIMNNLSERSLVLLDEIGRGTSTYDGISIAWSLAEYLSAPSRRPRTLFATHYHELNELAGKYEGIRNFHVATREVGDKVIFLRKLSPGGSEHSFGIHVAGMAGMPKEIVARAAQLLGELEGKREAGAIGEKLQETTPQVEDVQLSFFQADPLADELMEALASIDLNNMSPLEAMVKLSELQARLRAGRQQKA